MNKLFTRIWSGEIIEIGLTSVQGLGVTVMCENIKQAEEMFKTLDSSFSKGKDTIEKFMEIPFED